MKKKHYILEFKLYLKNSENFSQICSNSLDFSVFSWPICKENRKSYKCIVHNCKCKQYKICELTVVGSSRRTVVTIGNSTQKQTYWFTILRLRRPIMGREVATAHELRVKTWLQWSEPPTFLRGGPKYPSSLGLQQKKKRQWNCPGAQLHPIASTLASKNMKRSWECHSRAKSRHLAQVYGVQSGCFVHGRSKSERFLLRPSRNRHCS